MINNGGAGGYTPTPHNGNAAVQGTFVPVAGGTYETGVYVNSNGYGGSAGWGTYQTVTQKYGLGVGAGGTVSMSKGAFGQGGGWNVYLGLGPVSFTAPLRNILSGDFGFSVGWSPARLDFEVTVGKSTTLLTPHC